MKLSQFLSLSLVALAVSAQRIAIGAPADGISVKAGTNVTVEVDRPNSLSSATEVAVVIGFSTCGSVCLSPSDTMGATLLYNGPYNPIYATPSSSKPPHQNFTVTIPASAPVGRAQINVAHISMIGASHVPFMETSNITVIVVE